ncbi:unnamed protein product [Effrenium voratum]|uniref:Protein kinase domain-containing protein n=1 Tax=Effrenium voratum TaxID=2562239 RepID=A0AA36MQA9_9DINO|nr:unnamed protein product [Effrenium voratum]
MGVGMDGLMDLDLKLGEELGRGGFATVFQCSQGTQGRDLVAKVFKEDAKGAELAVHEERMLAMGKGHPNLLQSYGLFRSRRSTSAPGMLPVGDALLLERCDAPLKSFFGSVRFSDAQAKFVASSVLQGLAHLHQLRIIHRDVTPSNIMVADCGERIVLGDLGLAAFLPEGSDFVLGRSGTPGFLAPECYERSVQGCCSDIFSLGAVLYELLFSVPAFRRSSGVETILATKLGQLPLEPCGLAVGRSDQCCRLLRRMLATESSERPSASEALTSPWLECKDETLNNMVITCTTRTHTRSSHRWASEETSYEQAPKPKTKGRITSAARGARVAVASALGASAQRARRFLGIKASKVERFHGVMG